MKPAPIWQQQEKAGPAHAPSSKHQKATRKVLNRMASYQAISQTVLFGFGYAHFKQLIQRLCLLIGNALTQCHNN